LLQCVAGCCSVLLVVAVCCWLLQCVAGCCSVLLVVAVCCSAHFVHDTCIAVSCCRVFECVAGCCRVLQCVAVRISFKIRVKKLVAYRKLVTIFNCDIKKNHIFN